MSASIYKKREMCQMVSEVSVCFPLGWACVCACVRAHMCIHTCAHVYLCMSVEGLLGEKHMGVVGRTDKLKHKTANSKERGIL